MKLDLLTSFLDLGDPWLIKLYISISYIQITVRPHCCLSWPSGSMSVNFLNRLTVCAKYFFQY